MEKLDKQDGNSHRRKNNINQFTPLYESNNEEGTQYRMKPKTPIIVPGEKDKGRKNKGGQIKINKEDGNNQENKTTAKVYNLNIDKELNGDFGTEYH